MLTLIEEEADSFAKKAEMYYRRRPELIRFIQELYTSHRDLAERFEHVSGELQKSNKTLASLFPDKNKEEQEEKQNLDDEKKKSNLKKIAPHMSRESARREIYKLKKEIVVIETEKEFIKSSYLNGLEKYHDHERSIAKIEEEVRELQDEFGNEIIVEDDEAQVLMVITTLRSCQEILLTLYQDHRRLTKDIEFEYWRIIDLTDNDQLNDTDVVADDDEEEDDDDDEEEVWTLELKRLSCNIPDMVDVKNIMELSEKIDVIVVKVVDLESRKLAYKAHVRNLKSEIDDLESSKGVRYVEKWEVSRLEQVHRCIHDEGVEFQSWFNEACVTFNNVLDGFDFDNGKTQVKQDSDSSDSNCNKDENENKDEPDWEKLFKQGLEDREKILLSEYTSILRNYKEVKKRLEEEETNKKDFCPDLMITKIRELKNCIQTRDEHIKSLKQILETGQEETEENQNEDTGRENTLVVPVQLIDEQEDLTLVEERFRRDIDKILEENLQFWLRFTSSSDQVHKFQSTFEGILGDIQQLKIGTKKVNATGVTSIKKKLKDLGTNTSDWVEQNAAFKEELQYRFSSLRNIKEEISNASDSKSNEEEVLSEYQASRFQGEVSIMAQENNKVAEELGSGLDHVRDLQEQVTKALVMLEHNENDNTHQSHHRRVNGISKTKLFIFNIKPLKPMKPLKLPCMKPQKQNSYLDAERL